MELSAFILEDILTLFSFSMLFAVPLRDAIVCSFIAWQGEKIQSKVVLYSFRPYFLDRK